MALRVWLPLNGTLENKGISNVTVTNNGATIDNNGKIGKCYYFNSVYASVNNVDYSSFGTSFSVAFWYKINTAYTGNRHLVCLCNQIGWARLRFTCAATSTSTLSFNIGDGNNSDRALTTPQVIGSWQHIVFTFDNKVAKVYVNGILAGTAIYSINPSWSGITKIGLGGGPDGNERSTTLYLNDVRIYNHCLSAKEVKEISQGLVLHYKLDNPYVESTTNLITTEDCLGSRCYNGATDKYGYGTNTDMYKTIVEFNGKKCTKLYMGTNGNSCYPYVYIDNMFTSDGTNQPEYKTLSFDYYTTVSTSIRPYKLGSGSGTATYIVKNSSIKTGTGTNSVVIPVEQNTWNHIEITFHGTTAANAEWGYIQNQPAHTSNTANYWLFANMQLESKDHATGYAGVGGSRTEVVVKDSSGYENNGNIIGILTTVQDSPRYKISTNFNGRPCAISSNSSFSHLNTFTYNCWFKRSTDEPAFLIMGYQYGNNSSGSLGIDNTGCAGFHYYAHANGNGDTQVGSSHNCNDNTWHMLTATYDGVKVISYLDGQKTNEKTVTLLTSSRTFVVNYPSGSENSGTYRDYQGQLSDVRVYATALSAEDIADLYHTPASIDNLGNAHAFELVEQETNIFKKENIEKYNTKNRDIGIGEWVLRNGEWSINIRPEPFYKNNYNASVESGMLMDEFLPNTQYIFDMWIDLDDVIYNGNYVGGGFYIHYTDNTRESCVQIGGNGKGFQHFVIISNKNKSISHLGIYYYTSVNVYYRWDSIIKPYSTTSFSKEGINYSYLIENNDKFSIENGGCVKSVGYIEK